MLVTCLPTELVTCLLTGLVTCWPSELVMCLPVETQTIQISFRKAKKAKKSKVKLIICCKLQ